MYTRLLVFSFQGHTFVNNCPPWQPIIAADTVQLLGLPGQAEAEMPVLGMSNESLHKPAEGACCGPHWGSHPDSSILISSHTSASREATCTETLDTLTQLCRKVVRCQDLAHVDGLGDCQAYC